MLSSVSVFGRAALRTAVVRPMAVSVARLRSLSSLPDAKFVKVDVEDRVATITLSRPDSLNALNVAMGDEFTAIVGHLRDNCADIGAVVLTGEDLSYLIDRSKDSPARNSALMRKFYERFLVVRTLPVPVIAAINGPAIGAGLCLAMGCDVRIASRSARMGVTFVKLGLHPGMGATHFMSQIIGPQAAARMLLTGDVVDGDEAADMGLVLKAVDREEVVAEAFKLAQNMASQAPEAVRSCVRSLRMKQDEGLDKALWREADAQAQNYASPDLFEGVTATAEKRAPVFTQYDQYDFDKLRLRE